MNQYVSLRRFPAHGISLIEVTFAIGVILIGLVGLTSILPLAGRRAQDSLDFDTAAAISQAVASEVVSRKFITEAALSGPSLEVGTGSPRVFQPFCLDPYLVPTSSGATSQRYDLSVFPFYSANHDPLMDPSSTYTDTPGFVRQPRMKRVGLSALTGLGLTTAQQFEVARTWTESPDDLPQLRPKDRTLPAILTGLKASSTTGFSDGKRIPTGAYSWMITVDPDPDSRYATMSVVVFQGRERMTTFPSAAVDTPSQNALSERVALVVSPTGFSGGAGGSVRLLSSGNTLSNLTSGDWLMLSRTVAPAPPLKSAVASQVHRWYRVVATDGDAEIFTPTDNQTIDGISVPNADSSVTRSSATVWSRNVILDGPDWQFSTTVPNAPNDNSATYATLVENVVIVNEQTISLADF